MLIALKTLRYQVINQDGGLFITPTHLGQGAKGNQFAGTNIWAIIRRRNVLIMRGHMQVSAGWSKGKALWPTKLRFPLFPPLKTVHTCAVCLTNSLSLPLFLSFSFPHSHCMEMRDMLIERRVLVAALAGFFCICKFTVNFLVGAYRTKPPFHPNGFESLPSNPSRYKKPE